MLIQGHSNKLETNVQSETQNFGIGDASVVIDILRNRLYEHKIQTLVQEYICNARDAMREIGKGNAFEVTVPTSLNPVFKVRDFGPGISPDRMKDVFVMYGASTKRGSNSQTGGFGIGAKSAWSYTDSFTIVTHIDGIKRSYVAHTGVNNNGRLDHVGTTQTDEPNGTEIQVPVGRHDIHEFKSAVFRAIYFWNERPTIKGELDIPTLVSGYRLNDTVEVIDSKMIPDFIGDSYYRRDMLAVIDGVAYPINEKLIEKVKALSKVQHLVNKKVILHFGNGIVEVSASRESIADSKHSIDALNGLARDAYTAIKAHVTKEFGKVKSTAEFFHTYAELSNYFDVEQFAEYGGYKINAGWVKNDIFKKIKMTQIHTRGRRGRVTDKIRRDELSEAKKDIEIKNIPNLYFMKGTESSIKQNKRLKEYFKNGKTDMILIEAINGDTASLDTVINDLGAKDFLSLTWTELPKEPKVKIAREDDTFCLHVFSYQRHSYTSLNKNTEKYFYVQMDGTSWGAYEVSLLKELDQYLKEKHDTRICGVSGKVLKLIDGDANFSPLSDWLESFKPSKKQMAYVKAMQAKNREDMKLLSKLKGVEDDGLTEMVSEYKAIEKNDIEHLPEMLAVRARMSDEVSEFVKKDEALAIKIAKEYPLVQDLGYYSKHADDIVVYINAKFNSKKGK